MNINKCNNFIEGLKDIHKRSKIYLAVNGDRFYFTPKKTESNLNTARIKVLAQEALACLNADSTLSYQTRAEKMLRLHAHLKHYTSRLYKSKTLLQRIGHFFGCKSKEEKQINRVRSLTLSAAKKYQNITQQAHTRLSAVQRGLRKDPVTPLKLIYLGTLDGAPLEIPTLDGLRPHEAFTWMLQNLARYLRECPESERAEVQKVYAELNYAYRLLLALYTGDQKVIDVSVQELREKINALPEGERIIIPGGYRKHIEENAGHGALYEIKREANGSLKFSIINTGEGVKLASPIWDGFKNLLNEFVGNVQKWAVSDRVYTDLNEAHFSVPFFQFIFSYLYDELPTTMKEITQRIDKFWKKKSQNGREHTMQRKGSCEVKAITSWMKGRMSPKPYRKNKLAYTLHDVSQIPALQRQAGRAVPASVWNLIGKQAAEVIKKRRAAAT